MGRAARQEERKAAAAIVFGLHGTSWTTDEGEQEKENDDDDEDDEDVEVAQVAMSIVVRRQQQLQKTQDTRSVLVLCKNASRGVLTKAMGQATR
mmetsp:Transcript_79415/g.164873  ORF Transcript_79415/g.164873 Transcript_79415/m.164873 type:complete len:94 (+) Transcript_79415:634-915(+)